MLPCFRAISFRFRRRYAYLFFAIDFILQPAYMIAYFRHFRHAMPAAEIIAAFMPPFS